MTSLEDKQPEELPLFLVILLAIFATLGAALFSEPGYMLLQLLIKEIHYTSESLYVLVPNGSILYGPSFVFGGGVGLSMFFMTFQKWKIHSFSNYSFGIKIAISTLTWTSGISLLWCILILNSYTIFAENEIITSRAYSLWSSVYSYSDLNNVSVESTLVMGPYVYETPYYVLEFDDGYHLSTAGISELRFPDVALDKKITHILKIKNPSAFE